MFFFHSSFRSLSLCLENMAADDSVASLYAMYKPIWAAEEADRCTRWAAFLAELAGGDEEGEEEKIDASTLLTPNPSSALALSPEKQAAGLAALDALLVSSRSKGGEDDSKDEPRREKLARLRALVQAGLPMVRERDRWGWSKHRGRRRR